MRRKGREIAVQTLYSLEYLGSVIDQKAPDFAEHFPDKLLEITASREIKSESKIYEFAHEILENLLNNLIEIDQKIQQHSLNWSMDRIAKLDKCILRIATYEMLFTETAPAVIMNEAIEISKKFCSESSGKFINGILNSIAEESRKIKR